MEHEQKWSVGEGGSLPLGFGFKLAANEKAMTAFANMSDDEKQRVVDESKQQHTKKDMDRFVNRLGNSQF